MLGQTAVAVTPIAPAGHLPLGQVEVRGEIWKAALPAGVESIPAGIALTVLSVDGLTLTVSPKS
jgi:membrane protein implicated in regulation of membrane protease activity